MKKVESGKTNHRRQFLSGSLGLLFSSTALLNGCHLLHRSAPAEPSLAPPPLRAFVDHDILHSGQIRRLVILPFENRTTQDDAARLLERQLARQIQGCGMMEVIDVSQWYHEPCSMGPIARGEYPFELLAEIYRRFNADAVMFGSLNDWKPYWPVSMGATIHLVDTKEARVLSTVDGNWTVADSSIAEDYDRFLNSQKDNPAAQDPRLLHSSPTFFSDYVARRIVEAWK